jgi:hypothetical protein
MHGIFNYFMLSAHLGEMMSSRGRFATPADFPLQISSYCTHNTTAKGDLSIVEGPFRVHLFTA